MASHQDRLIAFLKKDVGGAGLSNEQIREFSTSLKELDILNLSNPQTAEWVMVDAVGQQVLIQLISWYSLGLLTNLVILKQKTKGK